MTDQEKTSLDNKLEPGTRARTLMARGVLIDGQNLDLKMYFDNYYIHLEDVHENVCTLTIAICTSPTNSIPIQHFLKSYLVDFYLVAFSTEGKELYKVRLVLDSSTRTFGPEYFASFGVIEGVLNSFVDVQIQFNSMIGLDVPPLRDYSVPNDVADVTLIVEEKKFHLNKGFLASHSPFFERIFFGDFVEKSMAEITLKDVSAETFTNLLDVLHQELYPIQNRDFLFPLLRLADQWAVKSVIPTLKTVLQGCPDLLNFGEKIWIFDTFRMTVLLQETLHNWKKSYANQVTEELFNELSDSTKFAVFTKSV